MENKVSVSCGSQVTIQHVEALKERFLNALSKPSDICYVNASKVEKLDTAGAQLLYAFLLFGFNNVRPARPALARTERRCRGLRSRP